MYIYQEHKSGITSIELIFLQSGSIYAKDGVANFLAYMFDTKGVKKLKEKFYKRLEDRAIEFNAGCKMGYLYLNMEFLNEDKRSAILALKRILKEPNLSKDAFLKAKKELLAKKESLKNNYDYIANTNLFRVVFKNTPLEHPVIGDNIEEIELEDVKKHFNSLSDLVVLNAGERVKIDLEYKSKKPLFFEPKEGEIVETKDTTQAYIYFAAPFNVTNEELYLAKVATYILGAGGFGSRLMEEIRVKRGYAYSAYAFNEFTREYRILKGYLQTELKNQDVAKELVKDLIAQFVEKGVSEEELENIKKFILGSEPLRVETVWQRVSRRFNEYYLGLDDYYKKELKLIEKLSLDRLNEFIKSHYELNRLSFSVVTR